VVGVDSAAGVDIEDHHFISLNFVDYPVIADSHFPG